MIALSTAGLFLQSMRIESHQEERARKPCSATLTEYHYSYSLKMEMAFSGTVCYKSEQSLPFLFFFVAKELVLFVHCKVHC